MWLPSLRSYEFYDRCQRPRLEILQGAAAGASYIVSVAGRLNFITMQASAPICSHGSVKHSGIFAALVTRHRRVSTALLDSAGHLAYECASRN
jgi:hypothetical protein